MADWKDTLNLPTTGFPMKANLQVTEPQMLARWDAIGLYRKLREHRRGAPIFILHDGPPYANGNVHLGTALNKISEGLRGALAVDGRLRLAVRAGVGLPRPADRAQAAQGARTEERRDQRGRPAPRLPRSTRRGSSTSSAPSSSASACSATGTIRTSRWTAGYQAAIVRAFGRFVEQGMVYKGKKPVHWCISCRTALAEAEVEYQDHVSPSIYVEFPLGEAGAGDLAARVPALKGRQVSVLIWTTTPWTIPSNLALAFHPDADYGAYEVDGAPGRSSPRRSPNACRPRLGRTFARAGREDGGHGLRRRDVPPPALRRATRWACWRDYVTLDTGTGIVHTAPGHGSDDFHTGVKYGLDIYAPVGR